MSARAAQSGFSLLEVLVAFVILVAALSVIYPLLSNGLRAGAAAEDRLQAMRVAQTQLARLGHDLPLTAGHLEGEAAQGYRWSLDIEPYWPWTEYPPPAEPRAWQVALSVSWTGWRGTSRVEVQTLRLGEAEAGG